MKKIILSYDYELFFGISSGTVQKTLIEPTNYLLDVMDKYGQKGNFFVDWLMLKYLKEENTARTQKDYNLIVHQLKDIVRRGHRIELHIHPHWIDAKYNGDGTWDFSKFEHYSLNAFTEEQIIYFFEYGVNFLTSIAREVDSNYKIVAFRAGGWSIQPFSKIKNAFVKVGIKIDSSIAPMSFFKSKFSSYDFRGFINMHPFPFKFNTDVLIPEMDGGLIEVPISVYKRSFFIRMFDKLYKKIIGGTQHVADGTHKRDDLADAVGGGPAMLTMSWMTPPTFNWVVCHSKSNIITVIDHPKDFCNSVCECLRRISNFESITYNQLIHYLQ